MRKISFIQERTDMEEQQQKILVIDHNLAFDEENSAFDEHIFAPKNRM